MKASLPEFKVQDQETLHNKKATINPEGLRERAHLKNPNKKIGRSCQENPIPRKRIKLERKKTASKRNRNKRNLKMYKGKAQIKVAKLNKRTRRKVSHNTANRLSL